MDMKLIDIKDTLPVGFIPIQETVDTRESPLTTSCHDENFLPSGIFLDIFMCIFLRKHFRRPYCVPQINPAAFDICLTWFSKEFSVFWVAACK